MQEISVERVESLSKALAEELLAVIGEDDAYANLVHEHRNEISSGGARRRMGFAARRGTELLGYAHVRESVADRDDWFLNVITRSDAFDVTNILFEAVNAEGLPGDLTWWARGAHALLCEQVASKHGLRLIRRIERMQRPLNGNEGSAAVATRAFTIEDLDEVVRINNEAFSWLPERSGLTSEQLRDEMKRMGDHFDDLLVAEVDDKAAGFCWTKRQPAPVGELYVLAIDNAHQGKGLGRRLLFAGMAYLYETLGARVAELYVEHDNVHAIALYEHSGFANISAPMIAFAKD